jgi:hypothetical protein
MVVFVWRSFYGMRINAAIRSAEGARAPEPGAAE